MKKELVKVYVPIEVKEALERVAKSNLCSVSTQSLSILYCWLVENNRMERLK